MVSIVEALADCLETMRRGPDLESCLERYPEYRTQLQALLAVASLIRPLPEDVVPSPDFTEATRSRILEAGGIIDWYHLSTEGGSAFGGGEDAPEIH